jgi:hypothetical protein
MRQRIVLALGLLTLTGLLLLGCSIGGRQSAQLAPTPTKTQRPLFTATLTPAASPVPSETPVSPTDAPPTHTPQPPTATAVPPTDTAPAPTAPPPTDTAIPPTAVPATNTPAPPTNTPRPQPTSTPAPPTNTPRPQVDFVVREIYAFEDGSLGPTGLHNVYVTVVDAGGTPLDGIVVEEVNNSPNEQVVTGNKGPGKTEYTMWAGDYKMRVVGDTSGATYNSETTHVMSIVFGHAVWDDLIRGGLCESAAACEALGPMHFSYNLTFQRTW